jgi:hypothetical protein
VEVHGRATDVGIRGVALGAVVDLSNPERALEFLKPIAENNTVPSPPHVIVRIAPDHWQSADY